MKAAEYDEMIGLIETWWGVEAAGPWRETSNFDLFAALGADDVFETLLALRDGGRYPDWPPKPPALRSSTLDLMRGRFETGRQQIEEKAERYDWAVYSAKTYGGKISLVEAVEISAEAQRLGLPAPSPSHPWRRPDETEEDASPEPVGHGADPAPGPTGSGQETASEGPESGPPDEWDPR